jgi:hypothetical protein
MLTNPVPETRNKLTSTPDLTSVPRWPLGKPRVNHLKVVAHGTILRPDADPREFAATPVPQSVTFTRFAAAPSPDGPAAVARGSSANRERAG